MRCASVALASAIMVLLHARAASAQSPLNTSGGPQLAWSWGKASGVSWGWEVGVGYGPQRLNVGQVRGERDALSYAVAEPYTLYIGGTLGMGYTRTNGLVAVFGLWEGLPVVYPDNCQSDRRTECGFLFTVALGYRYFGAHQIYLTPKAGVSQSATACDSGPVTTGG